MKKNILNQYTSLIKEREELICRIESLEKQIEKIEEEGKVADKVMGGEGGLQPFKIEGFPIPEYTKKKMWVRKNKSILQEREAKIAEMIVEVEKFISKIDDSHIRRIIMFRVVDNLSWGEVAKKIGGGNNEESVKKAFHRYVDRNNESCPTCPEKK